jgi:hypothetical protein
LEFQFVSEVEISAQVQPKPLLTSYDSGEECSLAHLVELVRLIESEDRELEGYLLDDTCLHVAE